MRPIDADVIMVDLNDHADYADMLIKDIKDYIEEQPTIEAEPERRSKWIPVTNGRGGFECEICHQYAPSYQDGVEWLSKYCPNCGAKMDGGGSDV